MEMMSPANKLRLGVVLAVILIVAGFTFRHDVGPALLALEHAVMRAGPLGPVLFVLAYSVWGTLCLPGPIMLAAAGTLFATHPLLGLACVVVGDTVAQALGFLIARQVARDKVQGWVGGQPWFRWLEEQTRRHGATGVGTIRLMPFFPNSLANYAFGLTSIAFLPYLLASVAGTIPSTSAYVVGTAGIIRILRDRQWEHDLWLALGVLLVLSGALALLGKVTRPARPPDPEVS